MKSFLYLAITMAVTVPIYSQRAEANNSFTVKPLYIGGNAGAGWLALAGELSQLAATRSAPLDFKGNYLGMPLLDFKLANNLGPSFWINSAPRRWNGKADAKYSKQVHLPLCTDDFSEFPGSEIPRSGGEVLCNNAPFPNMTHGREILGEPVDHIYYRFYDGKLYSIQIFFSSRRYREITDAFRDKYGEPVVGSLPYKNGYGATWTGETVQWKRGTAGITAIEGSGNGPGQTAQNTLLVYMDVTYMPPSTPNARVDF